MAASFAKLLRTSKLVHLGSFDGVHVTGRIVHRVNDDIYVDFGLKFNAICKRPEVDRERYVIGQKVRLKLFDPELSERFLGSREDLTLLEADAILLGILEPRKEEEEGIVTNFESRKEAEEGKSISQKQNAVRPS